MHVDIVRIREENLQFAKRIVEARLLADPDMGLARCNRTPVHRTCRNFLAVCIDLIAITVEIARIPHDLWQHFIENDRARHTPGRVEYDRLNLVIEEIGLMGRRADNHIHPELLLAILIISGMVGRLVDHDIAFAEIMRQPAQTLHRIEDAVAPD